MTLPTPRFTLERHPLDLRFRFARLVERVSLSPDYVRLRVGGGDLEGFGAASADDDHVRLFFPSEDVDTVDAMRAQPSREFTPLAWGGSGERAWLDLEFALHGDDGVAGVWAATAPIGAQIGVGGPRGTIAIDGEPDAWFLAADETAIAQVRRYCRRMSPSSTGRVLIEVADAARELAIESPVPVEFVHRGADAPGSALIRRLEALDAVDRPGGDVFVFVAAEQSIVRTGRALALERWGLDAEKVVIKGYWKSEETGASFHAAH
ncbi:siderophore-interacting protein [Microbacterium sp. SORGH_AS_0888]|uniref:siderophore-interacting protein n=1 Tax=Microbacterium sp. SORGH_AS_0888 TaxID=3041791 RepID=UPI00278AE50E|nr:siderophore-interacting protein [Microbacterium sp. SORGH_AS_0888]MDQ1128919.1 NADPH-dependent ferric siderophore reductase [Microbacterium sp. SORGH_AS_0888]